MIDINFHKLDSEVIDIAKNHESNEKLIYNKSSEIKNTKRK